MKSLATSHWIFLCQRACQLPKNRLNWRSAHMLAGAGLLWPARYCWIVIFKVEFRPVVHSCAVAQSATSELWKKKKEKKEKKHAPVSLWIVNVKERKKKLVLSQLWAAMIHEEHSMKYVLKPCYIWEALKADYCFRATAVQTWSLWDFHLTPVLSGTNVVHLTLKDSLQ